MNTRLLISLLCAGALAFACAPRSRSDTPVALASMLPIHINTDVERPHRASNARAEVKLDTHFDVAVQGNAVHFELVVKNVGGKHAELNFADGQAYDFVVADSAGARRVAVVERAHLHAERSEQATGRRRVDAGERIVEPAQRRAGALHRHGDAQELELSSRAARRIHDPVREL
jgi:hypothetical protein